MEYVGYADGKARSSCGDGLEFIAFWLVDGRVAAGMNVNVIGTSWTRSET